MDNWKTLLSVKLDYTNSPGWVHERYISYKGNVIKLTQSKFDELIADLGDYVNSKEKLTRFIVQIDDDDNLNYFVEYKTEVFDFRTREYTEKTREVTLEKEQTNELYVKFKHFFNKFYIEDSENFYSEILNSVSNVSIAADKMLQMRNDFLKDSDIYMLPDYPISDEERQGWIKFRQELRDLTDQEGWPNDLEKIEFPVSPMPIEQGIRMWSNISISDILMNQVDIDSIKDQIIATIKKWASLSVKIGVLSSISRLRIPLFMEQNLLPEQVASLESDLANIFTQTRIEKIVQEIESGELNEMSEQGFTENTVNYLMGDTEVDPDYVQALEMINEKIDFINKSLAEYNANFTIGDLINQVIDDSLVTADANNILGVDGQ